MLWSEEGLVVRQGGEMQRERWTAEGRDLAKKGGNQGNQSWEVTGDDEQALGREDKDKYPRAIAAKDTIEISWLCVPVLDSCLCIWYHLKCSSHVPSHELFTRRHLG